MEKPSLSGASRTKLAEVRLTARHCFLCVSALVLPSTCQLVNVLTTWTCGLSLRVDNAAARAMAMAIMSGLTMFGGQAGAFPDRIESFERAKRLQIMELGRDRGR